MKYPDHIEGALPPGYFPTEIAEPVEVVESEPTELEKRKNWRNLPMHHRHAHILEINGYLPELAIREAFYEVDRSDFLRLEDMAFALVDHPLHIGYEQTNSTPTFVAFMLDALEPASGQNVLDVGAGSGWTTTLLGYVIGPEGRVTGTERIPELVRFANRNIAKYPLQNAVVHEATDVLGKPENGPYDRILVSADTHRTRYDLAEQLKVGGIMIFPVGNRIKKLTRLSQTEFDVYSLYDYSSFVPLIDGPAEIQTVN